MPPRTSSHGSSMGPAKEGNGLFWLKWALSTSGSRAQTCRGHECWLGGVEGGGGGRALPASPSLSQRFCPEKEGRERFGSPRADGYLEHTLTHTHTHMKHARLLALDFLMK